MKQKNIRTRSELKRLAISLQKIRSENASFSKKEIERKERLLAENPWLKEFAKRMGA